MLAGGNSLRRFWVNEFSVAYNYEGRVCCSLVCVEEDCCFKQWRDFPQMKSRVSLGDLYHLYSVIDRSDVGEFSKECAVKTVTTLIQRRRKENKRVLEKLRVKRPG